MSDWIPPWDKEERELAEAGYSLDKIPKDKHEEHLWADGLLLFWFRHHRLPDAFELASELFDEWDDPVSTQAAEEILKCLTN